MSASHPADFCGHCLAHSDSCECSTCPQCAEWLALRDAPVPSCGECPACDQCNDATASVMVSDSLTLCTDCAAEFRRQQRLHATRHPLAQSQRDFALWAEFGEP